MNSIISAERFLGSLPEVVQLVRRGARFTVLYHGHPAFQVMPLGTAPSALGDLESDPLYHAKPLGRSTDGGRAANHDPVL